MVYLVDFLPDSDEEIVTTSSSSRKGTEICGCCVKAGAIEGQRSPFHSPDPLQICFALKITYNIVHDPSMNDELL